MTRPTLLEMFADLEARVAELEEAQARYATHLSAARGLARHFPAGTGTVPPEPACRTAGGPVLVVTDVDQVTCRTCRRTERFRHYWELKHGGPVLCPCCGRTHG